jgi:hypothetical protein
MKRIEINGKMMDLDVLAEEAKLDSRRASWPQVDALLDAGWKFELPEIVNGYKNTETEPWQWYWRRPAKRKNSKGRRYHSTNQAYNAMMKSKTPSPK